MNSLVISLVGIIIDEVMRNIYFIKFINSFIKSSTLIFVVIKFLLYIYVYHRSIMSSQCSGIKTQLSFATFLSSHPFTQQVMSRACWGKRIEDTKVVRWKVELSIPLCWVYDTSKIGMIWKKYETIWFLFKSWTIKPTSKLTRELNLLSLNSTCKPNDLYI